MPFFLRSGNNPCRKWDSESNEFSFFLSRDAVNAAKTATTNGCNPRVWDCHSALIYFSMLIGNWSISDMRHSLVDEVKQYRVCTLLLSHANQTIVNNTLTQPRKKGKTRSFNNWSKIDTNSLKAVEAKILLIKNVETLASTTFFDIWRKFVVAKGYWILFLWQEAIPSVLGRITDIQCYFNPKYFTTQKFHNTFRLETNAHLVSRVQKATNKQNKTHTRHREPLA